MVESTINLEQFDTTPPGQKPHGGCASCGSGKALAGMARCGNGLEKIYPTTAIRFGYMRYIGEFTHSPDMKFTCGALVIIQTRRGIEIGEQVSLTCSGCDKSVTREQMKEWVGRSGEDTYMFNAGRILREATAADLAEFAHIQGDCQRKRNFARQVAQQHKLPLHVVECECPLGGERILFYFTAAERIDFRSMVKDLATEYRTRIEMRQIGARDEARLLADYETCGREVCCKVFLKTLKPISMRMAKVQKATLDPSQVSGRCGRLKCCLRYEHTGYEELDKRLPRVGAQVRTNHGEGVVVNRQILTQLLQIRTDDNTLVSVVAEDILAPGEKASPPQAESVEASHSGPDTKDPTTAKAAAPTKSPPPRRRPTRPTPRRQTEAPRPDQRAANSSETPASKQEDDKRPARRRRKRRRRRRPGNGETGGAAGNAPPPTGA